MRKNYVIDSSLLVFDPTCITSFVGNNVIIPNCEVRKLEKFTDDKRTIIRYQANEALNFIKSILKLSNKQYKYGVKIPESDITLYILSSGMDEHLNINSDFSDEILAVMDYASLNIKEDEKELKTVLVSRVLSLRVLAQSKGKESEDYMADKILADNMFVGITEIDYTEIDMQSMYKNNSSFIPCPSDIKLLPNEFLIVKDSDGEIVQKFRYSASEKSLKRIEKSNKKTYSIKALNDLQTCALDILSDPKVKLVSLIGGPGTGKTLLSVASAFQQVIPKDGSEPRYSKVIFIRPMVAAGEEMGFLPGNEMEKLRPWMGSLYDSIETLLMADSDFVEEYKRKNKPKNNDEEIVNVDVDSIVEEFILENMSKHKLEMMPTTYMRGRTFHNTIVIVDEAQGVTPHIMKMILTRIGKNSKVILAGDPSDNQIDNEVLASYFNGLICASQKMKGSKYSGIVQFEVSDTERSNFVADVERFM